MPFEKIVFPCGKGGINKLKDTDSIPISDLEISENITTQDNTWKKIEGATKINTTVFTDTPKITALHDFSFGAAIRIAATNDGKIVKIGSLAAARSANEKKTEKICFHLHYLPCQFLCIC